MRRISWCVSFLEIYQATTPFFIVFVLVFLWRSDISCLVKQLQVQDVGAEKDAITLLRAPTHFGRPNWDRVFPSIADKHPETDVGVVCCPFP